MMTESFEKLRAWCEAEDYKGWDPYDGLMAYEELTGDMSFHENMEKGFKYYIESFFEADGTPKYYNDRMYPIDIHCPGQLFVTLSRLHKLDEYRPLAEKVMNWTIFA